MKSCIRDQTQNPKYDTAAEMEEDKDDVVGEEVKYFLRKNFG
jgi:hypothetical protein